MVVIHACEPTLCVCLTTAPTMNTLFWHLFACVCHAGPPQRADCLTPMGNKHKYLFDGHYDALPVGESNQESATFRLRTRRSTWVRYRRSVYSWLSSVIRVRCCAKNLANYALPHCKLLFIATGLKRSRGAVEARNTPGLLQKPHTQTFKSRARAYCRQLYMKIVYSLLAYSAYILQPNPLMERPYKSKPEDSGYFWLQLPATPSVNCQAVSTFRFLKVMSDFFIFFILITPTMHKKLYTKKQVEWGKAEITGFHAFTRKFSCCEYCRRRVSDVPRKYIKQWKVWISELSNRHIF